MADDASYTAFLQRANNPPSPPLSSTETTTSSVKVSSSSKHPFLPLLNNKLASLSAKTFVSETDEDFHATFVSSSELRSWSDAPGKFPDAADLETQVDGGRKGKKLSLKEWDSRGEYKAVVEAVKVVTKSKEVQVYTVQGRGGRFEVFILAKMEDGLVGFKAKGVAT
jgi:activator of HSP90 ATPase